MEKHEITSAIATLTSTLNVLILTKDKNAKKTVIDKILKLVDLL